MTLAYSYRGDYIQGKFLKVADPNGEIENLNPGNLELPAARFPFRYEHVNEAVTAARRAFHSWKRIPISDRLSALSRYRDALSKNSELLSQLITLEIGKPLWESREEVAETKNLLDATLTIGGKTLLSSNPSVKLLPRGVSAVFGATDLPCLAPHRYLMPALIHGNTVVFKSSKYAPTVGQFLAHLSHEAGIPPGVFNVIHGSFEIGRRLASHPTVDLVFFVGSFEKAQKIQKQVLGDSGKTLVLDTGGKNGFLVWEDCQFETALQHAFFSSCLTSGQQNRNAHRVFVHDKYFDRFVQSFHSMAKRCKIGYGMNEGDDTPFMGPLLSEKSLDNYLGVQGIALREGCEEIMRGKPLERKVRGHYVSPSIHIVTEPKPKCVYEQTEIFGPNTAFYRIKDLDEAIEWLNLSEYGLVCSVYTGAKSVLEKITENVRVGVVHWNLPTTTITDNIPQGGLRKSGNARPMGSLAFLQCTYPVGILSNSEANFQLPKTVPDPS